MVTPKDFYNEIADFYDEETKSPVMLAEDIVLFNFLRDEDLLSGSVLDAGCGTGLLLDLSYAPDWKVTEYFGYDFSEAMLQKMRQKWPRFKGNTFQMDFLDDHLCFYNGFDSVLSLNAGLNCLVRSEVNFAFRNLWSCVKKGGTMCLMIYGNIAPEERDTSLHSILSSKQTYPYVMIEEGVIYNWLKDLPESSNIRIYPFSQKEIETDDKPMPSSDNMSEVIYHQNRIESDLDEAIFEFESSSHRKKGVTNIPRCSFLLCLADKIKT